ncbi:MAG: flagellar biosynthesis anti-sigma factor FlgM [Chloroflexota bacterium]|nr:MAG: flagellar biosynthesis anti-sigma factor FlgM [Chloroflexota bacterium]
MAIERILKGLTDLNVKRSYGTTETQQSASKPVRSEQTSARPDEVVLSQRGVELQKATQAARDVPDVRQDRVEALQKQIQAGAYHVSDEDLLRKMMGG